MFLLMVWVGPVTIIQTDTWRLMKWIGAPRSAEAKSSRIPAGMAMVLEPGMSLELHLRDGTTVEGRFLERTLLDSATYAPRFAAKAGSSSYVPFALGETLRVSLRDGRDWVAPFAGYGELTLLLRSPAGPEYLRVPFEFASEIRRVNGDRVEPGELGLAFRNGLLPSAEALQLESRDSRGVTSLSVASRQVPVEDIEWAAARDGSSAGSVVGIVVLSVIVSVVLVLWIIGNSIDSAFDRCGSIGAGTLSGVQLTTRPFDLDRGCYVDDPLAVADPWPGPAGEGASTAPAQPAMARALTR